MEQKAVKRGIKKEFYDIEAPMTAMRISLYGGNPEEFEGKTVILDLTKSLRGRSFELKMRIKNDAGKLVAIPINLKLAGSYIRRAMHRGSDYVEDSFIAECRDAVVRIKPFLITRKNVSRGVRKALRETATKYIISYIKVRSIKELFSDIMTNKLQKGIATKLKKIYPLAMSEIRIFEFLKDKTIIDNSEIAEEINEVQ
ncbi:MAG: hypothetical protein AABX83_00045 [Nanoarchaeota archaeon]